MQYNQTQDKYFMQKALDLAKQAAEADEIPIAAILVRDNKIILQDHNRTRELSDPLAHAEKLILNNSPEKYLYDYTLYVTLEPCLMCAGMIIWRRLGRLVFAAYDKKAGAVGSVYNALLDRHFNHNPKITSGLYAEESQNLLRDFFKVKR